MRPHAALAFGLALGLAPAAAPAAAGERAATVLLYHRFGEDSAPSTNTTLEAFETHLRVLEEEGRPVVPLSRLAEALEGGPPLPEGSVVITVDDAFRSFATEALPRLRARGWPAALFVATEPIDLGLRGYLSWDELGALAADPLVEVAHHGHSHGHLVALGAEGRRADVEGGVERLRGRLGIEPEFFAFPYGEYDAGLRGIVRDAGFRLAFGQHSGAAGVRSEPFSLPRFSLSGSHAGEARLRLALSAHPMEAEDLSPGGPLLPEGGAPVEVAFRLAESEGTAEGVGCFLAGRPVPVEAEGRVLRLEPTRFPPGRTRLNCTRRRAGGGWLWLGRWFRVPGADD